jgi:hypothetical protein
MSVRSLQFVFGIGDCLFALILLALYAPALLHSRLWPPTLEEQVLLLVAGSALPLALVALRHPVAGGMAQFAAAYLGNQLLHEAPLPFLRAFSWASMLAALAILLLAVFRGILEVTQEAFGEPQEQEQDELLPAA